MKKTIIKTEMNPNMEKGGFFRKLLERTALMAIGMPVAEKTFDIVAGLTERREMADARKEALRRIRNCELDDWEGREGDNRGKLREFVAEAVKNNASYSSIFRSAMKNLGLKNSKDEVLLMILDEFHNQDKGKMYNMFVYAARNADGGYCRFLERMVCGEWKFKYEVIGAIKKYMPSYLENTAEKFPDVRQFLAALEAADARQMYAVVS